MNLGNLSCQLHVNRFLDLLLQYANRKLCFSLFRRNHLSTIARASRTSDNARTRRIESRISSPLESHATRSATFSDLENTTKLNKVSNRSIFKQWLRRARRRPRALAPRRNHNMAVTRSALATSAGFSTTNLSELHIKVQTTNHSQNFTTWQ